MLSALMRPREIAVCCLVLSWIASCSIYDTELLAGAHGGNKTNHVAEGDGGSGTGGHVGGDGDGDQNSSGGDSGDGGGSPMGGEGGSGGDPSTGGIDGAGGDQGGCPGGDCCPDNPDKDEPGECGCEEPEDDTDGDSTPDCVDLCPDEPTKIEPGHCGCTVTATDEPNCAALKNGIIHRYSFNDSGGVARDSVSGSDGTLENAAVQSGGFVVLDGVDQYVSLPAGMISSLTDATFEAWFTWNGGGDYQRIMDFGDTTGSPAVGNTYLYLAASRIDEGPGSGFSLVGNSSEIQTEGTPVLETGVQHHIVLVVDETNAVISLYINGSFQSGVAFSSSLMNINDVHGFLGKSLFEADSTFNGEFDEFRIYDAALTLPQITYSRAQGPDATVFD